LRLKPPYVVARLRTLSCAQQSCVDNLAQGAMWFGAGKARTTSQKGTSHSTEIEDNLPKTVDFADFEDASYPQYKTDSRYASWNASDASDDAPPRGATEMALQALDFEKKAVELKAEALKMERLAQLAHMKAYTEALSSGEPYVEGGSGQPSSMSMPPPGAMPGIHPGMWGPGMMGGMPGNYPGMMPGMMPGFNMPMSPMTPEMMAAWGGMPGMQGMPPNAGYPNMNQGSSGGSSKKAKEESFNSATGKTTVMWKNLPNNYTRDDLLGLINKHGFESTYDFFYSPIDFTSNALVGYAFLNFVSTEEANRFYDKFQNFTQWNLKSEKVSQVTWSHPLQGLDGHVERYRNSPVMHADVTDEKKPVLLQDGIRIAFPLPTKKLRAPHLKDCRPKGE